MIWPPRFQQEILVNSYPIFLCTGLVRGRRARPRAHDEAAIRGTRQAQKDRASPADVIDAYVRAKDGNRPHLLRAAFTDTATLRMHVRTAGISFPPGAVGREAIAQLLVSRFNETWENIYTLCVGSPPRAGVTSFACGWLVAMSSKTDGDVRDRKSVV